jgi:transposase
MDAILWIARTGAPRPDLPYRFGKFDTVYRPFNRWAKSDVLARVMVVLSHDADLENLLPDSTMVRAHQQAAGAEKGGWTTIRLWADCEAGSEPRVHIAVDALGNPVRLILTGGQIADVTKGAVPIDDIKVDYVIADKGLDRNALVEAIESGGTEAVIPLRSNRTKPRNYDCHLYLADSLSGVVERLILAPFPRSHFRDPPNDLEIALGRKAESRLVDRSGPTSPRTHSRTQSVGFLSFNVSGP